MNALFKHPEEKSSPSTIYASFNANTMNGIDNDYSVPEDEPSTYRRNQAQGLSSNPYPIASTRGQETEGTFRQKYMLPPDDNTNSITYRVPGGLQG